MYVINYTLYIWIIIRSTHWFTLSIYILVLYLISICYMFTNYIML